MTILVIITSILLLISFIANKRKTLDGLKSGAMQFLKLLPSLLSVIILVSITMFFIPENNFENIKMILQLSLFLPVLLVSLIWLTGQQVKN